MKKIIILSLIFSYSTIYASEEIYLKDLRIENYDINFNKDIHEYYINIEDEDNLNIDYELSNDNGYVSIIGNGNFNNSDNIININLDNDKYIIHAYKTITVNNIVEEETYELSDTKKEIVKYVIITISSIIVFCFYYVLFINKTIVNI